MIKTIAALALSLLIGMSWPALADAPFIDPVDDAQYFGEPDNQLFWTPQQQVSGFRNMEKLSPARKVAAGDNPYPLPERYVDLGRVQIITGNERLSVDDYVVRQNVAGLIVVKDGTVVYERYELGNGQGTRWISYSVAKSVTSLALPRLTASTCCPA